VRHRRDCRRIHRDARGSRLALRAARQLPQASHHYHCHGDGDGDPDTASPDANANICLLDRGGQSAAYRAADYNANANHAARHSDTNARANGHTNARANGHAHRDTASADANH
jgi:hypothetical protein